MGFNKNQIINRSAIWDLHIHTCECPKGSSDFAGMDIDRYIECLINIFSDYSDLEMISFTDHNRISKDVYSKFNSKNTGIKLIPGIEIDTYLYEEDYKNKTSNYKHLIFYFDDKTFDWNKAIKINEYLEKAPVYIYDLIDFFITEVKDTTFVISPHFLKQDNRGIDADWTDSEITNKQIDKYMDQMFCFWEASGIKKIERAVNFLREFDRENKVSIISFSDSNNPKKLKGYLDNPKQYFNALPNFEGIRMVGSDCRRILRNQMVITDEEKGKYIGCVTQGNNTIYFSNKLNTVIGGRGSGKSLLIDGIAEHFNNGSKIAQKRKKFIKKLAYKVYNMKNQEIKSNFKLDYFDQGYITKVFEDELDMVNTDYFSEEFANLNLPNAATVKTKMIADLNFSKVMLSFSNSNIVAITNKLKLLPSDVFDFSFNQTKKKEKINYESLKDLIEKVDKIIPKKLQNNRRILEVKHKLVETIYIEANKYNIDVIRNSFATIFNEKYSKHLNDINEDRKQKNLVITSLKQSLKSNFNNYIDRVNIINSILSLDNKYSDCQQSEKSGSNGNVFIFKKENKVQNPIIYLHNTLKMYFDSNKIKSFGILDKNNINNLPKMVELYCFNLSKVIMESKNEVDLDEELFGLKSLEIKECSSILYYKANENKTYNLQELSPGTKANILMEYIVFKDTDVPLLIDQPEDNIDNSTIYRMLTAWFSELKTKRQVIVATHDPNIVVNSDAENIIVCKQTKTAEFEYTYGALEYGNNINNVANILDGGSQALERRLVKYGETD